MQSRSTAFGRRLMNAAIVAYREHHDCADPIHVHTSGPRLHQVVSALQSFGEKPISFSFNYGYRDVRFCDGLTLAGIPTSITRLVVDGRMLFAVRLELLPGTALRCDEESSSEQWPEVGRSSLSALNPEYPDALVLFSGDGCPQYLSLLKNCCASRALKAA